MILIDNIGVLATLTDDGEISDAAMLIDGEFIAWCGKKTALPSQVVTKTIDAKGCLVIPGLIDCHTHLLFAGSRPDEFLQRMDNQSYEAIMAKGGGIANTVNATALASDEALLSLAKGRLNAMLAMGVTTVEAKSGYGLSFEQELRGLRLLKHLDAGCDIDIHRTFLGAHVVPKGFKDARDSYIDLVMDMLAQIKAESLATDCDVFCEQGAFSVEEAKKILKAACDMGFSLRAHVQQLSLSGGISLLREVPLRSISHADFLHPEDITLIAQSGVVTEALPIAALFVRSTSVTPVPQLRALGAQVAIATDFNPGTAMCHDLVLAARLGVVYFGFSVGDALAAITKTAASSLGYSDRGILKPGKLSDVVITNCSSVAEFFYDWTKHPVAQVMKRGKLIR